MPFSEPPIPPFRQMRSRVLDLRFLTADAFVLRLERNGLDFIPGQRLLAGRGVNLREYSIFSGRDDPYLEILVKRIEGGAVSPLLASLAPGDELDVSGPEGDFLTARGGEAPKRLFVASGTGIAPYRCLLRSGTPRDYRLIHGVRHAEERYCREEFPADRYLSCVSQGGGDFQGRVSDWLRRNPADGPTECYLSGNSDMIYECFSILSGQGIGRERIHAEIYF